MVKFFVRILGVDAVSGEDVEVFRLDSDQYSPDLIDELVQECLERVLSGSGQVSRESIKGEILVSAGLSADEHESVRPSLCLSGKTIQLLCKANAEFEFDPYV